MSDAQRSADETLVRTFAATDQDGDAVTFSLESQTPAAHFRLDEATGELFVLANRNYETLPAGNKTITATVKASTTVDGAVVKSQNATTHTVTIGDVDDAPTLQYSGTKTSFDENNDDAVAAFFLLLPPE